ncbi:MAG TPA: nuclear transport factor 2 family protein [Kofleriaceae bacterium]|jgi:ketosteroid isomerase-like protein
MPSRARVDEFIAAVLTNRHDDAIAAFYTEDATLQELDSEPRRGRASHVEREVTILAAMESVVTHPPDFVSIDGDRVAIHWVFEFRRKDGKTRVVDEIAMQRWDGDLIASERFFYDRASAAWKE